MRMNSKAPNSAWVKRGLAAALATGALAQVLTMGPAQAVPVTQNSFPFPIRQIDLPANHYVKVNWDHGGDKSRDFGVVRWNGSSWVSYDGPSFDASDNDDTLIFGTQVISPVDGTVVSCWRNHPDNEGDVVNPGRESDPQTIIRAGNHLNILTPDNKVMLIAHLQQQSIPSALCPIDAGNDPDGTFVKDANAKNGGEFPVEAVIPKAIRPKVSQGQYLGRVGNSGASSGPHLHVHLQPVPNPDVDIIKADPLIDVNYHGVYIRAGSSAAADESSWQRLDDKPMPAVTGTQIFASPFLPAHSQAVFADSSEGTTVALPGSGFVTASRNALGNFAVAAYGINESRTPYLIDSAPGDFGSHISMARPGTGPGLVTAMRDGTGKLKLIGWTFSNGQLERRATATGLSVNQVAVTGTPGQPAVVTAVRDSDGRLRLITWKIDNLNGTIEQVGEISGAAVSDVAVTAVHESRSLSSSSTSPFFRGVVTASRDAAGNLRLDSWAVGIDLKIAGGGSYVAGSASRVGVATARSDAAHDSVVTIVRDGEGRMRLTHWAVAAGGTIERHNTSLGGPVDDIGLVGSGQDVIATVQVGGTVRLFAFRTYADGRLGRDGENLPFSPPVNLSLLPLSFLSPVSAPVSFSGRTYVLGLFGTQVVDTVAAWEYTM